MHVLVTGGLGVNGSRVTRKLIERGHHPVVIDQRPDFSLVGGRFAARMHFVDGDFTAPETLHRALQFGVPDVIIHMAAIVGAAEDNPPETVRINVLGTATLLDFARQHKIRRFVYTSSRAVYGAMQGRNAPPQYWPKTEEDPCNPVRVYDVTKYAAEGIGRNYARLYGLQFVALRFATIFGPGKTQRHGGYAVISRIIEGGLRGEPVRIPQGGAQRDDMIYVDDAAEAVLHAAEHRAPAHTEYNISTGIGLSLLDVAAAVKRLAGASDIVIGPGLDPMDLGVNYSGVLDNGRARRDLGFTPRFTLSRAVEDYAEERSRIEIERDEA
jgi:UDP-glucose 4-epimerase